MITRKTGLCIFFIAGCHAANVSSESDPWVMQVRFHVPGTSPEYMDKYFTRPAVNAITLNQNVHKVQGMAMANSTVLTVFFEDHVHVTDGENMLKTIMATLTLPKSPKNMEFTALCKNDLSENHVLQLDQIKTAAKKKLQDNVVTSVADPAPNVMAAGQFFAMFSDELDCDDDPKTSSVPIYILKD